MRNDEVLQNELCNWITPGDVEVLSCMVEQDHRDIATIAWTSDSVPYLYMLLPSKLRARHNARICSFRDSDGNVSFNIALTTGRHHKVVGSVEHTTGVIKITTARHCSVRS